MPPQADPALLINVVCFCVISFRPSLPRFSQSLALLRPSSALSDPVPCLPSLDSGSLHDATISLGCPALRSWLLVTRWRRPPPRVFRPISPLSPLRRFPGSLSISPLYPPLQSRPRSRSRSRSHRCPQQCFGEKKNGVFFEERELISYFRLKFWTDSIS